MSNRAPTYKTFIDWFGHGALNAGLANWYVYNNTTVTLDTSITYRNGESLRFTSTTGDGIAHSMRVIPGIDITYTIWLYKESGSGSMFIEVWKPDGNYYGDVSSTVVGEWVQLEIPYDPTIGGDWRIHVRANGNITRVGWFEGRSPYDDVTCDVAATRTIPTIEYGRDSARDLDTIRSGELGLELKNADGKYTRGNPDSVIGMNLSMNRQVLITADFQGITYILYTGFTQDHILDASLNAQSVYIPCQDILSRLASVEISTDVYASIRTGAAMQAIIAAAQVYPVIDRDLGWTTLTLFDPWTDSGATTMRWYSFTGTALTGIRELIEAEGPPAMYTVGAYGQIIFMDRLHRQRASYPTTPVITLAGCETPGAMKIHESSSLNYGWADIINRVEYTVDNRTIDADYSTVWDQPGNVTWGNLATDEPYTFTGIVDNGFYDAQVPIEGTLQRIDNSGPDETDVSSGIFPEDYDYVKLSGDVDSITVNNTSGTAVSITLVDGTDVFSTTTVSDMSMRARAIRNIENTSTVEHELSISEYGSVRGINLDMHAATEPDAIAVANLILNKRAFTRPTVTAVIKNLSPEYTAALLSLDLSAPVSIQVGQWFLNNTFTIESIEHEAGQLGEEHVVTLELEQVDGEFMGAEGAFVFDDPDVGFDEGTFGAASMTPDTVFILGSSEIGGPDVLTY